MQPIKLKKNLFNDFYWDIAAAKFRILFIFGGSGSGKSFGICQNEIFKAASIPGIRILFLSKTLPQAKRSTKILLENILKQWNLFDSIIINKSDLTYTFPNGSVITISDLFDAERLKGIVVDRIWYDECTESIDKNEFLEIQRRVRGAKLKSPQITFSCNPVDENHPVKELFYDKEGIDERIKCFKLTYKDNKFLSETDIKELESMRDDDYDQYNVYVLANWGKSKTGGEIYTHFSHLKHVDSSVEYDKDKVLQFSFDENTQPYITCIISQITDATINIIDEICIRQANLDVVLDEIERRYSNHLSGLEIMGDATSLKKNVFGDNFYNIIRNKLAKFNPILKVSRINQSVFTRTNFVNTEVLKSEKIKLRINPSCSNTIRDITNVKRMADGTKDKKMISKDGMRYQAFGHESDVIEYIITTKFLSEFHTYQTGGEFRMIQKTRPGSGQRY